MEPESNIPEQKNDEMGQGNENIQLRLIVIPLLDQADGRGEAVSFSTPKTVSSFGNVTNASCPDGSGLQPELFRSHSLRKPDI